MGERTTSYGPDNPHPLSQLRTELVWEGKYDEFGSRRTVDTSACAFPMQRIETIDQPRSEAAAAGNLALFERESKREDDFRNMLIWGDNKLVMASLLKDFRGKIDLIYIDPPFDVGADFTMDVPVGDTKDTVEKDQSTLEMVAYNDTWGRGTDSYLEMMYERLALVRDLLSEEGSIIVHVDWHVCHWMQALLDEVFGQGERTGGDAAGMRNEIIWGYGGGGAPQRSYQRKHDNLLWYSKGPNWVFNVQRRPYTEKTLQRGLTQVKGPDYELHEGGAQLQTWWTGPEVQKILSPTAYENLKYPTQKPESLLERIIRGHTDEGDLVADFFCGSGTTGAVAERLGRRWIMADLGRFAIHTSRKRLIELQRRLHEEEKPYRAFDVHNLGRYERQWWQAQYLEGADEEHRRVVLDFFKAEVLAPGQSPSPLIHGRKGTALCFVDGIDSIFTRDEAREVAKAAAQAGARECYCLAWEFEMDLRLTTSALENELGVTLKLIQIPREIMEKNRKSPPPFLEMAVLEAEPVLRRKPEGDMPTVDIKLARFLPSLAEVPTKELEAIQERALTSGFDFIDFWAVDFDWRPGEPFNHNWQDYRTRKDRTLKTVSDAGHEYPAKGVYTACVKVVDTFGCDTSMTVEVKI